MSNGKGSKRRPEDAKAIENNWEKTFSNKTDADLMALLSPEEAALMRAMETVPPPHWLGRCTDPNCAGWRH